MRRLGGEGGRSTRSVLLTVLAVVLCAGAGVVGLVVLSDGGDDPDSPSRSQATDSSTTTTEPLSEAAADLLARLERGRDEPLHVRLASGESVEASDAVTVEIWRLDDRVRQDVVIEGASGRTEARALQLPDGNLICQRAEPGGAWQCQRAASLATEQDHPAGLIEAVAANLAAAEVTATDDDIGGTPVRCFRIDRSDGSTTLCLTDDGVPMRLSTQGQDLTATTVERDVPGDVFTPPAEVPEP